MKKTHFSPLAGKRLLTSAMVLLLAFLTVGPLPVFAADTIEVSTGAELDNAIKSASSGSVISLAADIDAVSSATYSSKTLTLEGNGHIINGNNTEKTALRFSGTNNVAFRNLTFQNVTSNLKYGGGAIGVYKGSLTVENCTFVGNQSKNSSGDGGAVLIDSSGGTMNIYNSTFYGNISSGDGGAIASATGGEIVNSTIVGNVAASGKGGGLRNTSTSASNNTALYNCIVVGNTAKSPSVGNDIYRMGVDGGYNIVGAYTNSDNESWTPASTTKANVEWGSWLDAAPADHGGLTQTIALLDVAESPAVDSANAAKAPALDQRGISRDEAPDIGAYELEKGNSPTVDKSELESLIDSLTYAESDYTADSWAVYATALSEANAVVSGADVTQEQVNSALQSLNSAIDGLVLNEPVPVGESVAKIIAEKTEQEIPGTINFSLAAEILAANKVNTIEAVLNYDSDLFTVDTEVLQSDYDLSSVDVNEDRGIISIILGVTNENAIAFDTLTDIVKVSLQVKGTSKPEQASVTLTSFKLYSEGVDVDVRIDADSASTGLTYKESEKDGWIEENGRQYFYKNGQPLKGWQTISGNTYYFKISGDKMGVMFTGLQSVGGKRYYFTPSGAAGVKGSLVTGWTKISDKPYYFKMTGDKGIKGVMLTGWQTIGGKTYYFKRTGSQAGVMLRGFQSINGKRYYFKQTGNAGDLGRMFTGWQTIGGKRYFLKRTGAKGIKGVMLTGLQSVDGKQYYFSKDKATYGQLLKNK